MPPSASLYQDRLDTVRDMSREGKTGAEMAKALGVSMRTVQRIRSRLIREDIVSRRRDPPRGPVSQSIWDEALKMLQDRAGYAETARTLGLHENYLGRKFPGYELTREEVTARMNMARRFHSL